MWISNLLKKNTLQVTRLRCLKSALLSSMILAIPAAWSEKLPFNGKTLACSKSLINITPMQYADSMMKHYVTLTLEQTSKLKIESGYRVSKLNVITLDKAQNSQVSTIRNSAIAIDMSKLEVPHMLLGEYVDPQNNWKEKADPGDWFYIKPNGQPLSKDRFSYAFDFQNGIGVADVSKEGEKTTCNLKVIDKTGKDITSSYPELKTFGKKFFLLGSFHEGLAPVKEVGGKKFQFVNSKFALAFPKKFDEVSLPETGFYENLSAVRDDDFWGYINKSGVFSVKPRFAEAKQFHNGMAAVRLNEADLKQVRRTSPDALTTFLSTKGKLWDKVFEDIRPFYGSVGVITFRPSAGRARRQFVNAKGEVIGKTFDEIGVPSEGLVPICLDGRSGFANLQGQIVIQPAYRAVGTFSEGVAPVVVGSPEGDKIGYIDKTGKLVLTAKFPIEEGYYVILPRDRYHFDEGLAPMYSDGKFGYVDKKGTWKVPAIYTKALPFHEGVAVVQR